MRKLATFVVLVVLVATLMSSVSFAASANHADMLDPVFWKSADSNTVEAIENGIKSTKGMSAYTGEKFLNETFEFDAEFAKFGWPSIGLRWSECQPQWGSANGYLIVFVGPAVELHKYVTPRYADPSQIVAKYEPNDVFNVPGKHKLALSAIDEDAGVRIKVVVDGKEVINYLDSTDPIKAAGYFSILSYDEYIAVSNISIDGKAVAAVEEEVPASNEDISMWSPTAVSAGKITAVDGGVKVTGGMAYYNVEMNQDVTYKFKVILESDTGWPCFPVRASQTDADIWGPDNYLFGIKKDILEFQKFRTDGGGSPVWKELPENTYVKAGEEHEYEITTVNQGEAVKYTVKIDGKEVFSIVDDEKPITEAGYFIICAYDATNPITLKDFEVIPVATTETQVDETPVDETPVDETTVDETPVDETPVDEGATDTETPVENPETGVIAVPFVLMALVGTAGLAAAGKRVK